MKTWTRAPRRLVCGNCCAELHVGDPMLVLSNPEQRWRKFRCVQCEGPAPADLPDDVAPSSVGFTAPKRPTRTLTPLTVIAADWKVKAGGG